MTFGLAAAMGACGTESGSDLGTGGSPGAGGAAGSAQGEIGAGGSTGSGGASSQGSGGSTGMGGGAGSGAAGGGMGGALGTGGRASTGGTTGAGGGPGAGGATHGGPWKIMPLGDSITGFCYPQNLSGELTAAGFTSPNFSFVGTITNNQGNCLAPAARTVPSEGHGCYYVTRLENNITAVPGCGTGATLGSLSELQTWAAEKPDVVLMHYGTNDVWNNIATDTITGAYSFVVDHFRSQNPSVVFFVAQILPMHPAGCTACETRVEALNAAVPAWAASKNTAASPVYVVNIWSTVDQSLYLPNSTLSVDGVHPMPPAAKAMADKWFAALAAHGIP
jgi:lysophospholipase L1-like esterase